METLKSAKSPEGHATADKPPRKALVNDKVFYVQVVEQADAKMNDPEAAFSTFLNIGHRKD